MIPSGRLVALASLPLILAIVAFWVPVVLFPMLALDVLLVGLALLDLALSGGRIEARREFGAVQSVNRPFEVELALVNTGWRGLMVQVTDAAPGLVGGVPVLLALGRGQRVVVPYKVQIQQRGEHRFGPVTVRWSSPTGLWFRQHRLEVADTVRVYPSFSQLRHYGLRAREDERRLPLRVRRRPGGETEFERLRPYVQGDVFRHIDWRATARKRELVTREYGQESNQNLIFLLDCGRMMSARSGDMTAFDHALNAAMMMGQVALRHGDRVGLMAFDREVRAWLTPLGGARNGRRLIRGTYDLFPSLHEPDYAMAFRTLSQRVRRRSLVVLLTSVVDEPNAELAKLVVGGLARRHLPLCVWVRDVEVDGLLEAPAQSPDDHYVRAAAAELSQWRERSLGALRQRGALVVDCAPKDLTTTLLGRYLEIKARRLL